MVNFLRVISISAALSSIFIICPAVDAQTSSCSTTRQYYSEWKKHPSKDYHYRTYYFKPRSNYVGYRHHYVIYKRSVSTTHVYYYNPYKKRYWGRCPVDTKGEEAYSHLPPNKQKPDLEDIQERDFPTPGPLPKVPESQDGTRMDLPPDDLPIG